ncbi:MAG: hypothetical protein JEZ07_20335 [Phycisphaerae bacterium]|nr:hypothetical protein [Phycisphaerae bacterium]
MADSENVRDYHLSARQSMAWSAIQRPDITDIMYGGGKGGGKSVWLCLFAYYMANQYISRYNIGPRKDPIPVGFLGRKRSVDFTDTTLETWKRFIPENACPIGLNNPWCYPDNFNPARIVIMVIFWPFDVTPALAFTFQKEKYCSRIKVFYQLK